MVLQQKNKNMKKNFKNIILNIWKKKWDKNSETQVYIHRVIKLTQKNCQSK